jgi:hypothetical protein
MKTLFVLLALLSVPALADEGDGQIHIKRPNVSVQLADENCGAICGKRPSVRLADGPTPEHIKKPG